MPLAQERRDLLLRRGGGDAGGGGRRVVADPVPVVERLLVGGEGHVDRLLLPLGRAAELARFEDADDLERDAADLDRLAERVLAGFEEHLARPAADDRDLAGLGQIELVEEAPADDPERLDPEDRRLVAQDPEGVELRAAHHVRHAARGAGREDSDLRHLAADRRGVVVVEHHPAAGLEPGPGAARAPSPDEEGVRGDPAELPQDAVLDPVAGAEEDHEQEDPPEDAERRQERAQLVLGERLEDLLPVVAVEEDHAGLTRSAAPRPAGWPRRGGRGRSRRSRRRRSAARWRRSRPADPPAGCGSTPPRAAPARALRG